MFVAINKYYTLQRNVSFQDRSWVLYMGYRLYFDVDPCSFHLYCFELKISFEQCQCIVKKITTFIIVYMLAVKKQSSSFWSTLLWVLEYRILHFSFKNLACSYICHQYSWNAEQKNSSVSEIFISSFEA